MGLALQLLGRAGLEADRAHCRHQQADTRRRPQPVTGRELGLTPVTHEESEQQAQRRQDQDEPEPVEHETDGEHLAA
jgi:hypothetical protein